jgi:hypothetical protein
MAFMGGRVEPHHDPGQGRIASHAQIDRAFPDIAKALLVPAAPPCHKSY